MEENNIFQPTTEPAVRLAVESGRGRKVMEKAIFFLLFLVSFLIPIFFVSASFISNQFGTSLLFAFGIILSVLIYIVSVLVSGYLEIPKSVKTTLAVFAIIPVVYMLAGLINGFSRMTFIGYTFDISAVGFIFLAFAYMFLISLFFKSKAKVIYSYFAFFVASVATMLFFILRMIFGVNFLSFGIFTSLSSSVFGSWNNVGIFFGICAILFLFTIEMLKNSVIKKIILFVALLVSMFFVAVVNFTSVWVMLAVCSMLYILYNIFSKEVPNQFSSTLKSKLAKIPFFSVLVFIISVAFIIWGASFGGYMATKLGIANAEVRPSLSVTFDIARNTIKSHPIFGSGPNTFVTQWLSYKPDSITATDFWDTNFSYGIGLIPTFAVTTGLFGLVSWLLFFGYFVYFGIKSIFSKIEDTMLKYVIVSSFFISLYLWVMTWIYVPGIVIFILTFFFTGIFFASMYTANIIPLEKYHFAHKQKIGFISSLVLVALFIGVASTAYAIYENSESLWYFQKSSYTLNNSGNISDAETLMAKAIATVPYDVYYRALSEIELYKINAIVSQDQTKVKLADIQKQFADTLPVAIDSALSAKDADQTNYLNWIALGRVYEAIVPYKIAGAYEKAFSAYSEALRYNPKNPGIIVLFARLEMANENLKSARNYVLQAIQEKQNYLDAYFLLSQIEVADKNLKGAIDSVTAASVLSPSDPTIFFQLGLLKYNASDIPGAIDAFEKSISLSPQYANAKYFLGLSYERDGQHNKAIAQFEDLKVTNPDSKEVDAILTALKSGKSLFQNPAVNAPEKASKLPVKEQ